EALPRHEPAGVAGGGAGRPVADLLLHRPGGRVRLPRHGAACGVAGGGGAPRGARPRRPGGPPPPAAPPPRPPPPTRRPAATGPPGPPGGPAGGRVAPGPGE